MIGRSHPSFGCQRAFFLFRIRERLIQVEAPSAMAVAAIELVLGTEGAVSPTCQVLSVYRDGNAGIRSDLISEVPYADFMTDLVDPNLLLGNPAAAQAFQVSLSEDTAAHVRRKAEIVHGGQEAVLTPCAVDSDRFPAIARLSAHARARRAASDPSVDLRVAGFCLDDEPEAIAAPAPEAKTAPAPGMDVKGQEVKMERLRGALTNMGFDKAMVKAFVSAVATRPDTLNDLVREGIVALNK